MAIRQKRMVQILFEGYDDWACVGWYYENWLADYDLSG